MRVTVFENSPRRSMLGSDGDGRAYTGPVVVAGGRRRFSARRGGSSDCQGEWCRTSPTRSRPCAWCAAPISGEAQTSHRVPAERGRASHGLLSFPQGSRSWCSRSWCRPPVSCWSLCSRSRHWRSCGTGGGTAHGRFTTRPAPRATRDPAVHTISQGRLLPSTVESLRADLHDQHVVRADGRRRRNRTGQAYPPRTPLRASSPGVQRWRPRRGQLCAKSGGRAAPGQLCRVRTGRSARAWWRQPSGDGSCRQASPCDLVGGERRFSPPEAPIRCRLELLVLDAWITVFLGVDPRSDLTLHARLVELFSRYHFCSRNGRTHRTWSSSSRSFVSDRCIRTSCPRALCAARRAAARSGRRPGSDEQSRPSARHDATRCRWARHVARLPSGASSPMVRSDTSGRRRRRQASWVVSRRFACPRASFAPGDAVPGHSRGLHSPGWSLRLLVREATATKTYSPILSDLTRAGSHAGRSPRSEYSPFGLDADACIGEALTRTFAIVVAPELSLGVAWNRRSTDRRVSPEHHWAPSDEFRVRFKATDPASFSTA